MYLNISSLCSSTFSIILTVESPRDTADAARLRNCKPVGLRCPQLLEAREQTSAKPFFEPSSLLDAFHNKSPPEVRCNDSPTGSAPRTGLPGECRPQSYRHRLMHDAGGSRWSSLHRHFTRTVMFVSNSASREADASPHARSSPQRRDTSSKHGRQALPPPSPRVPISRDKPRDQRWPPISTAAADRLTPLA